MKRKRKPGAGRKPSGPYANSSTQLTVRMPEDLRHQLEKSATKKGWSLTQELLWRLNSSYKKQRERESVRGHPVVRALGFLISELIGRVVIGAGEGLAPRPIHLPGLPAWYWQAFGGSGAARRRVGPVRSWGYTFDPERRLLPRNGMDSFMTPEARGDFVAKEVLNELLRPDPRTGEGLPGASQSPEARASSRNVPRWLLRLRRRSPRYGN